MPARWIEDPMPSPAAGTSSTSPETRPVEVASLAAPVSKPSMPELRLGDCADGGAASQGLERPGCDAGTASESRLMPTGSCPRVRFEANGRWVLRRSQGPPALESGSARVALRSPDADGTIGLDGTPLGAQQELDGVDIVAGRGDALRVGRWAVFGVWGELR